MIYKEYIRQLARNRKREDGREPMEMRKIEIQHNPFSRPEGSALIKMGDTVLVSGVKMEVGEPFPDSPDAGILMVGAEFSPIASPEFESGPPQEDSIELARVVDRGIRESKAIDMEALCIKPREKTWMVMIDIQILNHDGNLIDAAALASAAAIANTKMPAYEDDKVNYEKRNKSLPVKHKPIAVSFAKIEGNIFMDPTFAEEAVMDGGIVITVRDDGNVNSIQMLGNGGFSQSEIESLIDTAVEKSKEMRVFTEKSTKVMEFL